MFPYWSSSNSLGICLCSLAAFCCISSLLGKNKIFTLRTHSTYNYIIISPDLLNYKRLTYKYLDNNIILVLQHKMLYNWIERIFVVLVESNLSCQNWQICTYHPFNILNGDLKFMKSIHVLISSLSYGNCSNLTFNNLQISNFTEIRYL